MTVTPGLNQTAEALHRLADPHRHSIEHSRADTLIALSQLLAFVRGTRPDAAPARIKPTPARGAAAGKT